MRGGSNGARVPPWKVESQKFADETEIASHVRHFSPGASKWNKIERCMFCLITQNWRGRPFTDHVVVLELIGATTTRELAPVVCTDFRERKVAFCRG
jgi:hypothetical protein